jgi:TrmH family RNA methyltransferase
LAAAAGPDGPPLTARSGRVVAARRLARRQMRRSLQLFLVEGPAAVQEALDAGALTELFVGRPTLARYPHLVAAARAAGVPVATATDDAIAALSDTTTPQGVVGVARAIDVGLPEVLAGPAELVVILHELRDPGNVGTIVRSADAAGAQAVVVTRASADPYNGKAVRSSAGSLFHLPIAVDVPLPDAVQGFRARGCRILAADAAGRDVTTTQERLRGPVAWVFSNEAHGLRAELRQLADEMVGVPVYGSAESLNVAMAATVCLYVSAWARRSVMSTAQWITADGRVERRGGG